MLLFDTRSEVRPGGVAPVARCRRCLVDCPIQTNDKQWGQHAPGLQFDVPMLVVLLLRPLPFTIIETLAAKNQMAGRKLAMTAAPIRQRCRSRKDRRARH